MINFPTPPARLSRNAFVDRFGGVYEHSPWVAENTFDDGLDPESTCVEGLASALRKQVDAASEQTKLALLRAHPDLAGKLAVSGELTKESTSEQAGAGLDSCTPGEFKRFQKLNDTYKEKFRFPFILAVSGYHRTEILEIFERRINNDRDHEFAEALEQVHRIARIRLNALAQEDADVG